MSKTLNVTHKLRRNSAATWTSENPVLADGEPGYDTTNNILKIGDGVKQWNDLPAIAGSITVDSELSSTSENPLQNKAIYNAINGKTITEISTQYIRITDLSAGVYKLTYAGTKYIYYDGSSGTATHIVTGAAGAVVLVVNKYSTTYWHWYYINGTTSTPTIYYGQTNSSNGSTGSKTISSIITGSTTSSVTSGSSSLVTSGGVYTAIQNAISALGIKYKDIGSGGNFNSRRLICVGGMGIFCGETIGWNDASAINLYYGVTFLNAPIPVMTFTNYGQPQYADGKWIRNIETVGFQAWNASNAATGAMVIAVGPIDASTIN